MKRLTPLLFVALASSAHAGLESMVNPLALMAPSPFGGYGGFGGLGGLGGNPLGGLGALAALGALGGPALQIAPGLATAGLMNQLTNPYMGGPFAGNPLFQQSSPMPFAVPGYGQRGYAMPGFPVQGYGLPAYGAPSYGPFTPSTPNLPTHPFAAPQQQMALPNLLPMPQMSPYQQVSPYQQATPYNPTQAQSAAAALLPLLMALTPQPQMAPAAPPPAGFFPPIPPIPQAAQPAPVQASLNPWFNAPAPVPAPPVQAAPQATFPFPLLQPAQPAPSPAPTKPAQEAAPKPIPFFPFVQAPAQESAAAKTAATPAPAPAVTKPADPAKPVATPLPVDPALMMQMLIKAAEQPAAPK